MKKILTICIFTVLTTLLVAQISKSVNMTTAGTLSNLLTNTEKTSITNLTITGFIDARDFKCMKDEITHLTDIDIQNVIIHAYIGTNGTAGDSEKTYPANTIPEFSFCKYEGISILTNIKLPNSIIGIGDYAFCLCPNLKSINLPSSITEIGWAAFFSCNNLTSITLSTSLRIVKSMAFMGCKNLTSITLPASVTDIGTGVFDDCINLTSIYSQNTQPPTCEFMSFGDPFMNNCILYVPVGCKSIYQQANVWKRFSNIFETTTALKQINNQMLKIYTQGSKIIIEGALQGEVINIYTANGIKIETLKFDDKLIIDGELNKLYLVETFGKTFKVICN